MESTHAGIGRFLIYSDKIRHDEVRRDLMYFVDRDKLEIKLAFMEKQLQLLKTNKDWDSAIEQAAFERVAHTVIEAVLDTGNAMIDGFIMRDPGSYEDIVDILTDEKVIDLELSDTLKKVIFYRKMLVQQYEAVNHREILDVFTEELPLLETFPHKVRDYLINELGPISAFGK